MSSMLFKYHQINVAYAMDLVDWTIGSNKIRLYYPTCLKLAGGIRVAGKAAIVNAGESVTLWRDLAEFELKQPIQKLHREYRRSRELSNLHAWRVDIEGSLVAVYLDDFVAKFYCTDALRIQAALMVAGRQAKAWAGDDSTALIMTARLHNATPESKAS